MEDPVRLELEFAIAEKIGVFQASYLWLMESTEGTVLNHSQLRGRVCF